MSRARLPRLLRLPSFGLLLLLAALLLLQPLAERVHGGVPALAALHLAMLVLAVRLVGSTRHEWRVASLLAAPTMVLLLASYYVDQPAVTVANLSMLVVFYAYVIHRLFGYVFRDEVATVDDLFAATCIYVLLAMLFACVYTAQELLAPGSFAVPAASSVSAVRYWDLLYFSFTVLTSTGFGDIHPVARQARAFAVLEQVTGVMYVAILIARLTGMTPIGRPRSR